MKLPLDLVDTLNWRDIGAAEIKQAAIETNADATVEHYLRTKYPVYGHMIQFGIDYHNFMDNNDPDALFEFINNYKDSAYWRLAKFAKGLLKDIIAVKNTLLHPDISNGLVEGMNNDIKCIKRMGGGRAKVDLLAAKMVLRQLRELDSSDAKAA